MLPNKKKINEIIERTIHDKLILAYKVCLEKWLQLFYSFNKGRPIVYIVLYVQIPINSKLFANVEKINLSRQVVKIFFLWGKAALKINCNAFNRFL